MHVWVVRSFRLALQNTPLGPAISRPMASMLEAVRNRKLTADEVDALADITIGQLTALWRVRRACRQPRCCHDEPLVQPFVELDPQASSGQR